jgi:arsenite methyltransferase
VAERAPYRRRGEGADLTDEENDVTTDDALTASLKAHYGAAARQAAEGNAVGDDDGCASGCGDVFGSGVYAPVELAGLPEAAVAGSIGCANPVALAHLEPGEDVLDLGSGGGIDVLLSARRVGPTGRVYGIDMTGEMLELARANQRRADVTNAEFIEGSIEAVPLPDASVDVVLSNCVINLSADKPAVLAEAFRLLRPGGRLAIADVVADHEPDPALRADPAAWAGCIAGAVTRSQYRAQLVHAGFVDIDIIDDHAVADGHSSIFVRARTPPPDGTTAAAR